MDLEQPCLWAHSALESGREYHPLTDHLRGTAALAEKFADSFNAGSMARYAGLVHDVGKARPDWQARLAEVAVLDHQDAVLARGGRRTPIGIRHKTAGAYLAWTADGRAKRPGELVSQIVYGHHGSVPAHHEMKDLFHPERPDPALDNQESEAIRRVSALMPEIIRPSVLEFPPWFGSVPRGEMLLAAELLVRMVASAVYDADVRDTRQFDEQAQAPDLYCGPGLADLAEGFEKRRARLAGQSASPVAAAREELAGLAREAASAEPGLFRMAFPTGSGKTLSAARFAACHAARWGLRRMVYAAPFLSITTQNAEVMRRVFGSEHVLEHHSGADLGRLADPGGSQGRQGGPIRGAAENWDMPVVVTTAVQLFESLFSSRPSALRKVHRLAGSVIVLDEVQSLPDRLLLPILSALRHLTAYFGATVVLCSATQPAFDALPPLSDLRDQGLIRDITTGTSPGLANVFRRVAYDWRLDPRPPLDQAAREAAGHDQVLVIVNTTKDAARAHQAMRQAGRADAMHLSTRMAAAHRASVLADIRARLASGERVAVAATQLVEAGVDVDFPVVYRAWAPAEALCQAAGRANREGRLACGRVIVFDPADGGAPKDYATAMDIARQYFGPGLADPDDPDVLGQYYRMRYLAKGVSGEAGGAGIQERREALDFPEVARQFRMIDDSGVPVVVPYESADHPVGQREALIARARTPGGATGRILRELQPWTATLPRSAASEALRCGDALVLLGDLLLWQGDYDDNRGIEVTAGGGATVL